MIPHPTLHWNEILAAYADGEFEGRDDLGLLKQRVEEWLKHHPEAHAELAQYRRLKQLWQATAPPEPAPEAWREVLAALPKAPAPVTRSARPWRRMSGVAAALAACLALVVVLRPRDSIPTASPPSATAPADEEEVFSVASSHEVVILSVDGADTHTIVVGALPLHGSMELAAPGDVTVTSVEPDANDQMVPVIRAEGRPMIWARLDSE